MSEGFKSKNSMSEIFCPVNKNITQNNSNEINAQTPREVFRNDTTAIDIIVKQVKNKKMKTVEERKIARLSQDIENLRNELNRVNKNLEETKKCFRIVLFEIGKQLEAAKQSELKTQTRRLVLQLEKEKLKSILEWKTNLLVKLRKEMLGMRRIIKFVSKGIKSVPHFAGNEMVSDYAGFVNDLNDLSKQYETIDNNVTVDTTI